MIDVQAAVFTGPANPLAIETLNLAGPRSGEVLVKVVATGVCHSDLKVANGSRPWPTPLVLGHEGAGIVEAIGADVTSVRPGDHVVISWMPYCGRCDACLSGHPNHCSLTKTTSYLGLMHDGTTRLSRSNGEEVFSYLATASFGNWAVVPESAAVRIRPDAPLEVVALVGCAVATGVGAVIHNAQVPVGATVAVIGCGGVGLSAVAGASLAGAEKIIAVDLNEGHLERAKKMGATEVVNGAADDVAERIKEMTRNRGVDFAFEAAGLGSTIELAYRILRPRGTAVVVGQVSKDTRITLDPFVMSDSELTVTGSNYGATVPPVDFPMLVDLYMVGRLNLDALIEGNIGITEIDSAFEALGRGATARRIVVHEH
mgnify:CR=1 FL=1